MLDFSPINIVAHNLSAPPHAVRGRIYYKLGK